MNQQGRFTSVDPLGASADIGDPQSFNRYSYVQNNPVNLIDPDGMMQGVPGWSEMENGFWGSDAAEEPYRSGAAAIGEALLRHDRWIDERLKELMQPKKKRNHAAADEPDPVVVINTFAFISHAQAIAYYERQFGGSVYEQNGKFYPTALTRMRNFTAGVIDYGVGPPPIPGLNKLTLGRLLRTAADKAAGNSADENSWSYYAGSWVPDVVGAAAGGEAGLVDEAGARLSGNLAVHNAHHAFPLIGRSSHLQLTLYQRGVKASQWITRVPLGVSSWPARSRILFRF